MHSHLCLMFVHYRELSFGWLLEDLRAIGVWQRTCLALDLELVRFAPSGWATEALHRISFPFEGFQRVERLKE